MVNMATGMDCGRVRRMTMLHSMVTIFQLILGLQNTCTSFILDIHVMVN